MNPRIWSLGLLHRYVSIRCIFPHLGLRSICGRNRLLLDWRDRFAHSTLRPQMVRRLFMFFCTTCGRCYSFRRSSLCVFANPRNWIPRWRRWRFRIRCLLPHFGLRSICRRSRFLLNRRNRFTRRMFHCRWHCFRRNSLCVFMNLRSWILRRGRWRFRIRRIYSRFGLLGVCGRERLLPDRRSRFAHRTTYLRLALWWIVRLRRNRRIFSRYCSRLSGLLVLWNRFRSGFPLRFGFCFRQLVDSFFCQMADFLHGMVGGVCDLAALVTIV